MCLQIYCMCTCRRYQLNRWSSIVTKGTVSHTLPKEWGHLHPRPPLNNPISRHRKDALVTFTPVLRAVQLWSDDPGCMSKTGVHSLWGITALLPPLGLILILLICRFTLNHRQHSENHHMLMLVSDWALFLTNILVPCNNRNVSFLGVYLFAVSLHNNNSCQLSPSQLFGEMISHKSYIKGMTASPF